MRIYNIEDFQDHLIGNTEAWVVHKIATDDRMKFTFPKDTLEWRAAEYDLDISTPQARDVVFDLILHEPYMQYNEATAPVKNSKGKWVMPAPPADQLYTAPTKAKAWEAHQERLAACKQGIVQVNWPNHGPLLLSKTSGPLGLRETIMSWEPNLAAVEVKRGIVHRQRQLLGLEPKPVLIDLSSGLTRST